MTKEHRQIVQDLGKWIEKSVFILVWGSAPNCVSDVSSHNYGATVCASKQQKSLPAIDLSYYLTYNPSHIQGDAGTAHNIKCDIVKLKAYIMARLAFIIVALLITVGKVIPWNLHKPLSWLHHQMETFSALLAICGGIHRSPVDSP